MFIALILFSTLVSSMNNGIARTPPTGWMSWMYYTTDINEEIIKGVVDKMVSTGLSELYEFVCIDDGWQTNRNSTGGMVADPIKFPSGIPALVDYVHAVGLKFGIYTDVGSLTCGGQPGLNMDVNLTSQQYKMDVATFAEWNVDALKVDGCYQDPSIMNITYPALSNAINETGHAMWLSCSWPCYVGGCSGGPATISQDVYDALPTYCNTWRDYNDMYDDVNSLYNVIGAYTNPLAIIKHNKANRPGSWSDADMIAIGTGGLSLAEETMQMVMWSMFSSPLIMSNDLPNISPESLNLLLNKELVAIDQDITAPSSFNVTDDHTYCKNLANNTIALAGIRQCSLGPPSNITLSPGKTDSSSRLSNCLLPVHTGVTHWKFRDVINHLDLTTGVSVDCLVACPGACLLVATPIQ
jgi:alpha-N-acetylgalactosaminidase